MDVRAFLARFGDGDLTVEEIGRGMHLCYRNAVGLVEDAESLLSTRPGRSISLAILALEEFGKLILLPNAAVRAAKHPVSAKEVIKILRLNSHSNKLVIFNAYGSAVLGRLKGGGGERYYAEPAFPGAETLFGRFKQLGLYTDIFTGRFISPDDFGESNRELAKSLIALARERIESVTSLHRSVEASIRVAHQAASLATLLHAVRSEEDVYQALRKFITIHASSRV